MKKSVSIGLSVLLILSLTSFVLAIQGEGIQAQDGTGEYHAEIVEAGGLGDEGMQGPGIMTQESVRARIGTHTNTNGKQIQISENTENKFKIKSGNIEADCECELEQEQIQNRTRLRTKLSNGINAEVKIMPDTASQTALQRLRLRVCSEENNCKIELKEVGKGEEKRLVYNLQAEKQARFLGLFKIKMKVQSNIDAETGEVISSKKPWWAFLASETDEEPEDISEE